MRNSILENWFFLSAAILFSVLSGCGGEEINSSKGSEKNVAVVAGAGGKSGDVVELSKPQSEAIQEQRVGSRVFSVERRGVGSIDFGEDVAVVQAEAAVIDASAALQVNKRELARARDLYANGMSISQKQLDQAEADEETAAGHLQAARYALGELGKSAEEIDRIVAVRSVEYYDSTHKWLVANVPESALPGIKAGQKVDVVVAAYPDRIFHGAVAKVPSVVDPATHRSRIRCKLDDPNDELRAGMLADFSIVVQQSAPATAVSTDALVRESDGSMTAWVTDDRRKFKQRTVRAGLRQDGFVQILDGLEPGELVVTRGAIFLSNLLQNPASDQ